MRSTGAIRCGRNNPLSAGRRIRVPADSTAPSVTSSGRNGRPSGTGSQPGEHQAHGVLRAAEDMKPAPAPRRRRTEDSDYLHRARERSGPQAATPSRIARKSTLRPLASCTCGRSVRLEGSPARAREIVAPQVIELFEHSCSKKCAGGVHMQRSSNSTLPGWNPASPSLRGNRTSSISTGPEPKTVRELGHRFRWPPSPSCENDASTFGDDFIPSVMLDPSKRDWSAFIDRRDPSAFTAPGSRASRSSARSAVNRARSRLAAALLARPTLPSAVVPDQPEQLSLVSDPPLMSVPVHTSLFPTFTPFSSTTIALSSAPSVRSAKLSAT